jgi:hypothetical protein
MGRVGQEDGDLRSQVCVGRPKIRLEGLVVVDEERSDNRREQTRLV